MKVMDRGRFRIEDSGLVLHSIRPRLLFTMLAKHLLEGGNVTVILEDMLINTRNNLIIQPHYPSIHVVRCCKHPTIS